MLEKASMSNIHDLVRVINGISLPLRLVRVVQWLKSRTVGELHIISDAQGMIAGKPSAD